MIANRNDNFIKNPSEYFKDIWKNWYDFLNIDITVYPKSIINLARDY